MRYVFTLGLAILSIGWIACESDDDRQGAPALTGQVLDSSGAPVVGAAVAVVFEPEVASKSQINLYFVAEENAVVRLEIFDIERKPVRLLLDTPLAAGNHQVTWDGTSTEGVPVPNGLYYYDIRVEMASEVVEHGGELILLTLEPTELTERPHALTDSNGQFRIPLFRLPLGHETVTSENTIVISHTVEVFAFPTPGEEAGHGEATVEVSTGGAEVVVHLP